MSTRENLVAALVSVVDEAMKAAYPGTAARCTREIPESDGSNYPRTQIPADSTPLVILTEGDEAYPESDGGVTRVELPLRLNGCVKRREGVAGPIASHRNALLALLLRTAWGWREATPQGAAYLSASGPSEGEVAPDEGWCHVNVNLNFFVRDDDP